MDTSLGKNFIGAETVRAMLKTEDIGVVAPIPDNIIQVLNSKCPVHNVKDSFFKTSILQAVLQ
jgi:hypothetical protein